MSLFQVSKPSEEQPTLTREIAAEIYAVLLQGFDISSAFTRPGNTFAFAHIEKVYKEARRIEGNVFNLLPHLDMENPSIQNLMDWIDSSILSVEDVIKDVVKFNPSFDESRTWEQFLSLYKKPEGNDEIS